MPSASTTTATDTPTSQHLSLGSPLSLSAAQHAPKRPRSLRITGKLKTALDLMVYGPDSGPLMGTALAMDAAAREAGLNTRHIRLALDKPHVRQYLSAQKQVFRASASAQNISALVRLRDASGNAMAQLGAIKTLEQLDDDKPAGAAQSQSPGMVIVVMQRGALPAEGNAERTNPQQIELEPGEFNASST